MTISSPVTGKIDLNWIFKNKVSKRKIADGVAPCGIFSLVAARFGATKSLQSLQPQAPQDCHRAATGLCMTGELRSAPEHRCTPRASPLGHSRNNVDRNRNREDPQQREGLQRPVSQGNLIRTPGHATGHISSKAQNRHREGHHRNLVPNGRCRIRIRHAPHLKAPQRVADTTAVAERVQTKRR